MTPPSTAHTTMITTKLPAFQFYPGDWRKDPGVQALSYHDRGIWFEMLCLMHESEKRGVLLLAGKPMPEEALARLLGLDMQTLSNTIQTLLDYGVASRDEKTKALLCRRMVRDEALRHIRTEAGKKGGNPHLLKEKKAVLVNQNPTPSSSSSSSISSSEEVPPPPKDSLIEIPTEAEVIAFGAETGVPESYCIGYYARTGEKDLWHNCYGKVVDWRRQVTRFWNKDRATWKNQDTAPAPSAPKQEPWLAEWRPWLEKTGQNLARNAEYQYADPLVRDAFWRERKAA